MESGLEARKPRMSLPDMLEIDSSNLLPALDVAASTTGGTNTGPACCCCHHSLHSVPGSIPSFLFRAWGAGVWLAESRLCPCFLAAMQGGNVIRLCI